MCGIFGIVDRRGAPIELAWLQRGIDLVAHRSPDGRGFHRGDGWGLGHGRLAIIDRRARADQPLSYRGYTIVFNGAIYNYLELRRELGLLGHVFRSQSDTEVLLAAYVEWGPACLSKLNGMWAFAIHDPERKRLFCARDRFGIKPFYYTQIGDRFCWASEIKQFGALPDWRARVDRSTAYEFLVKGYQDHRATTFFEGVRQLRGGQYLVYDLREKTYQVTDYYRLDDRKVPWSDPHEKSTLHQLRDLLYDAVRLRLRADVPIGTALSGGLDSSSIVGVMHDLLTERGAGDRQASVSCRFEGTPWDEGPYIDAVVARTGLRSHQITPGFTELMSRWDRVIWQQDEPIAGASILAQHLVFERARKEGLLVMLDGQGADEILAGYEKFYWPWFRRNFREQPRRALGDLLVFFRLHRIGVGMAWSRLRQFRRKDRGGHPAWLAAGGQVPKEELFRRSPENSIRQTSQNLLREMGLPILLHYEDRNSMAFGVESRLPFLDHRLVEFCLALPETYKIRRARRKFALREAMRPLLPDTVYHRYDKMGFPTPQKEWMQSQASYFERLLNESREVLADWIHPSIVQYPDPNLRWRIISFAKWVRCFEVEL
ncbi:MAG: asparagine synthase (glutamine-hydrolyzing) [Bacteroidota bacterium]